MRFTPDHQTRPTGEHQQIDERAEDLAAETAKIDKAGDVIQAFSRVPFRSRREARSGFRFGLFRDIKNWQSSIHVRY